MSWLDIVVIVVIAVSTAVGLKTGLITAILSLAGTVGGIFLAGRYYMPFAEKLTFISSPTGAKIAAFIIILVIVMIIARIIAGLLKRVASALLLGWADRLSGAVLGLLLGAILCGSILAIWITYLGMNNAIENSALARLLLDRAPMVLAFLPSEFDQIRSLFQ